MITTASFERRNGIDNQFFALIPKGTQIQVEQLSPNLYEIIANIPITKDGDNCINVSAQELKTFT